MKTSGGWDIMMALFGYVPGFFRLSRSTHDILAGSFHLHGTGMMGLSGYFCAVGAYYKL